MRFTGTLALCAMALLLPGCQRAAPPVAPPTATRADHAPRPWQLPTGPAAAQPALVATTDGRVLLSWIDSTPGRRNALQFAAWDGSGNWQSAPRTIVVGDSLLVDASNPPQLMATGDGALWVQWIQKIGDAASELQLSRSLDGGFNWSAPLQVSTAVRGTELGSAVLWPQSRTDVGMAWLDGNPPAGGAQAASAPQAPVADTRLHAAVFDAGLRRSAVSDVDTRACDCCRVAAAVTTRGAVLAYRDRSASEIRDIAVARFESGRWSKAAPVHADNWKMTGCPVNGPAIASRDTDVVVAWYTGAGPQPRVQLARSGDAGDSFGAPVVVDRGEAVLGRVAVALDASQAWVLWLREDADGQSLWLARYTPDLSRQLQRVKLATLQGRGLVTGYPQLALQAGNAYVVWTDIANGMTLLQGAML
ncbi:hypothetical protein [Cognatiluteimonas profundi]|uniref:hypothetical protein n=1 Tax=Cognatiluteimonas profundi TaxID=2594501 RepID=UPI00131C93D5|nr:hypothetical protein [Lysobacter profundi]